MVSGYKAIIISPFGAGRDDGWDLGKKVGKVPKLWFQPWWRLGN